MYDLIGIRNIRNKQNIFNLMSFTPRRKLVPYPVEGGTTRACKIRSELPVPFHLLPKASERLRDRFLRLSETDFKCASTPWGGSTERMIVRRSRDRAMRIMIGNADVELTITPVSPG